MPCKNGGTCLDKADDKYVCVCPKCGCSTVEPFDNCEIDKAKICKTEKMVTNHVAHPYNCSKFIICNGNAFVKEDYVYNYQTGNVYRPESGEADFPWNVPCAKEIDIKMCADVTCANGGTCEDTLSGFRCHCPFGRYNGQTCENELTTCADITCEHGDCENIASGFYCNCFENYKGDFCQTRKLLCSEVICTNGATCIDTDLGYKCDCVAGYSGPLCETDIDECANNPCDATYSMGCEDKVDGYTCICHRCNCSSVPSDANCKLDATKACADAKGTIADVTQSYYLPHPYKCNKYIWCYLSGTQGVERTCAGDLLFNPQYPDANQLCSTNAPQCTDIDECANNPCDATYSMGCEDKVDGYTCVCHRCNCSSVPSDANCKFDAKTRTKLCKETTGPNILDNGVFYLPHPYKCGRYIWCTDTQSYDQPCSPPLLFNPDYTSTSDICQIGVTRCVET